MERSTNGLSFSAEAFGTWVLATFAGRMDAEGVHATQEAFEEATSGTFPVIVDLTGVTFMESLGVALLVRLAKRAREAGSGVAVIPGPGPVARLLGTARVDRILNVAFSLDDAKRSLGLA